MTTSTEHARRAAALALVLGLAACGAEPGGGKAERAAPVPTGHVIELWEEHAFADRWTELPTIVTGDVVHRPNLTGGWSMPNFDALDEGRTDPLWSDSTSAEVTFYVREVADRRVTSFVRPFTAGLQEPTRVWAFLNGVPVGDFLVPQEGLEMELRLPAEHQRPGLNRLSFDFSRRMRPRDVLEDNRDHRALSVNFRELVFEVLDPAVATRVEQATELLPEGSRADLSGEAIEQVSGSRLSFHLRVPPDARVVSSVFYRSAAAPEPRHALFRAVVRTDDAGPVTVAETRVAKGQSGILDGSLGDFAGEIVRLDLEIESDTGFHEPVLGAWIRPRVAGEEPPPDPADEAREAAAARVAELREELAGKPVVTVLLDACNPRYITAYGGRPGVTPNLDRIAAEGVLFEDAYAPASFTISSIASVLSSSYTWEHGSWMEGTRLLESARTYPELFAEAGYRTVGIVHSPNGSSLFGYDKGFETYVEVFRLVRPAKELPTADDVLPILDQVLAVDDDRPLFLWMHIIEPHEPYAPPEPWASKYDAGYEGDVTGDADTLWDIRNWKFVPTEREIDHIEAEYESNLSFVDDVMAKIRGKLEAAGIFDEGVFAVFSDHGEGFLEHDGKAVAAMGHGSTAYDEMTRIPMILRLPSRLGVAGRTSERLVGGLDLLPTLADLAGVGELPGGKGVSFAPLLVDPDARVRDELISHAASLNQQRFLPAMAIWAGRWKYVHTSGEPPELYDLEADPGERINLAGRRPVLAGWMRQELRRKSRFDPDRGGPATTAQSLDDLDPEILEQMKALGYVRED